MPGLLGIVNTRAQGGKRKILMRRGKTLNVNGPGLQIQLSCLPGGSVRLLEGSVPHIILVIHHQELLQHLIIKALE